LREDIHLTLEGEAEDCFLEIKQETGLIDDAEVLRRIFNQYLVDHVLVDPGFVEWFRVRHPRPDVMKLSEVVEEYELYKRQKATPQAF